MIHLRPRRPAVLARIVGSVMAAGLALAACSAGSTTTRAADQAEAPALPTPMATAASTSDGSWVVLPMGRLDQPINTFWQLLYQPDSGGAWSNKVEATATATNGGLLLAAAGPTLVVGIRPSTLLRYTPLIATSDAGRQWSNGLIDADVEARPSAIAVDADHHAIALTRAGSATEVITAAGSLSTWRTVTTARELATTPTGRTCRLGALTAVGYLAGHGLLGGSCAQPGVVGLFTSSGGTWKLAPVTAPAAVRADRFEVLSIQTTGDRTRALLAAVGAGGATRLLQAQSGPAGRAWSVSPALALPGGDEVTSVAAERGGATDVLLAMPGQPVQLETIGPSGGWTARPAPPAGTTTVAAPGTGTVDAFAGAGSTLSIWSLGPTGSTWTHRQTLHVPIQYGSSS